MIKRKTLTFGIAVSCNSVPGFVYCNCTTEKN